MIRIMRRNRQGFLYATFLALFLLLGFPSLAQAQGLGLNDSLPLPSADAAQRTVRVAVYYNPPLAYPSSQGKPEGIFIDLLEYIAEREGWQTRYVFCSFANCLEMARAGQVDLVPVVAYSEERAQTLSFNRETVLTNWGVLYSRPGVKVESLLDLNGLKVATLRGDIYLAQLKEMIPNLGITVTFLEVGSYQAVFQALAEKRADVGVVSRLYGEMEAQHYDVIRTPVIVLPVSLRFATGKGANEDLLAAIDRHLVALKGDPNSIYYATLDKYLGTLRPQASPWWHWALMIGGGVLALAGVLSALLYWRRAVHREQALIQEVAERQRAEQALQEASARYRFIFENILDVLFILDPKLCVIEVSPSVRAMLGYAPEELIGQCLAKSDLILPEDISRLRADAERVFRGEAQPPGIYRLRAKDGSLRYGEVTAAPLTLEGRVVACIGTIRDITERIRAQEEAERIAQQVEQAHRLESIGLLAGGVAHDFNNMLTAILGHIDLALMDIPEDAPYRADLQEARASGDRATQLTRQLLTFSRQQPAERVPLDVGRVVQEITKMLRRLIGESIAIRTEIAPDLWPIEGDALQLQQVVMNLAVNARDAMPQGGELTIQIQNIMLDEDYSRKVPLSRPGRFVRLSVSDTGTGMPPEVLEHIFEPFFTTKAKGEGTGLGLSVVYGIVRQHDGWVNVYSEVGKGTTFHIYLPAALERAGVKEAAAPVDWAALQGQGEQILLVEDEERVRTLAVSALETHGYRVEAAGSVQEALALFAQHGDAFDALFSDVILPDGTGLDLAATLRATHPDLPVLLTSGWAGRLAGEEANLRAQRYLFLQKPYGIIELLMAIHKTLATKGT